MKRSLLFSLIALVLFAGCGKQGGRTLTSASGSIYECLVVIPNATLTAEQLEQISQAQLQPNDGSSYAEDVTTLYDAVRVVMGADMRHSCVVRQHAQAYAEHPKSGYRRHSLHPSESQTSARGMVHATGYV